MDEKYMPRSHLLVLAALILVANALVWWQVSALTETIRTKADLDKYRGGVGEFRIGWSSDLAEIEYHAVRDTGETVSAFVDRVTECAGALRVKFPQD